MSTFLLIRLVILLILLSLQKTQLYHPQLLIHFVSPSDHFPIFTSLVILPPSPPPLTEHFFRCIKSINLNNFIRDIRTSRLITHPPTNLSDLVDCYNLTLSNILKISTHLLNQNFFDLNLQMLGSLLLFKTQICSSSP